MALSRPSTIIKPFAVSGDKNTIPIPTQVGITEGAASFETGFPPSTMIDISLGGIAPDGMDMNGILYSTTEHIRFINAGGQPRFDATLCAEIGGYPVGVVLQDNSGVNSYINILVNNTTDFNSTPASIGVSWLRYAGADFFNTRRGHTYTENDWAWVDRENGLIKQWGTVTTVSGGGVSFLFPTSFTTTVFGAKLGLVSSSPVNAYTGYYNVSLTGMSIYTNAANAGLQLGSVSYEILGI